MNAEIVERADAQVLGITARINPMQANYGGLWGQHFGPAAFQCTTATIGPTWGRIYGQVAECVHHGDEHFAWRARALPRGHDIATPCAWSAS